MSEMVTDTATAKASSDVRWPAITVRLTASGWPTAASTLSERPRFSIAICAKSMTCLTSRACSGVRRQRAQRALERRLGALEAEDVELLAQDREVAALEQDPQVAAPPAAVSLSLSAWLASARRDLIVDSAELGAGSGRRRCRGPRRSAAPCRRG